MSPSAAVLQLVGEPPRDDEPVAINFVEGRFVLIGADGRTIASSEHPRVLSKYAFANGAFQVRHAYNLKLAEDL